MPKRLPTVALRDVPDKVFFVDPRLLQLRNVESPIDYINFENEAEMFQFLVIEGKEVSDHE